MPSRFEPCGLNQMYSLRYGTLPIVRATGGLVDTVANYDEATGDGTGFVFHDLDPDASPTRSAGRVSTWYDRPDHIARHAPARHGAGLLLGPRGARSTSELYLAAYARRRGHAFPGTDSPGVDSPGAARRGAGRLVRPIAS